MIKVLFVCLGNICRSPMAEAVFRHLVEQEGLTNKIIVDSAGTGDWHIGQMPHKGTQTILNQNKISYEGIKARQVINTDIETFDYIIAMDTENMGNLRKIAATNNVDHIRLLLEFVPKSNIKNVPDPYYTGNFDEVYELILAGCKNLLETIRKEHLL